MSPDLDEILLLNNGKFASLYLTIFTNYAIGIPTIDTIVAVPIPLILNSLIVHHSDKVKFDGASYHMFQF
jgi:hypothetical protein